MSELVEKLINVRNNGSKRQAHIDLANECIQEVISLERQLEEAREIIDNLLVTDEGKRWLAKVLKEKGDE